MENIANKHRVFENATKDNLQQYHTEFSAEFDQMLQLGNYNAAFILATLLARVKYMLMGNDCGFVQAYLEFSRKKIRESDETNRAVVEKILVLGFIMAISKYFNAVQLEQDVVDEFKAFILIDIGQQKELITIVYQCLIVLLDKEISIEMQHLMADCARAFSKLPKFRDRIVKDLAELILHCKNIDRDIVKKVL